MHDINLIHPLTAAIATGATVAVVDDIETAIAWLDTHGGTQSLTRTGDTIAGVFLGIDFSIRLINKTKHSMNNITTNDGRLSSTKRVIKGVLWQKVQLDGQPKPMWNMMVRGQSVAAHASLKEVRQSVSIR